MTNYAQMGSGELRTIISDKNPGRSADVRTFVKAEHIWMLENEVGLETMMARRKSGGYPYTENGEFDPNGTVHNEPVAEPTTKPEPKKSKPKAKASGGGLEAMLVQSVLDSIELDSLVDMNDVEQMIGRQVDDKIKEVRQVHIQTVKPNGQTKNHGLQHYLFEDIVKMAEAGLHMALIGPAGSGKSTTCENLAEAIERDFYSISCNPQSTKVDFFGYMDANGKYVETGFYRAVKFGGVFMADEMDAANPSILTAINAATGGNKYVSFPNGITEVHEDFVFIAGMNTWGQGANRQYVGRNQLDAATLDRFVNLSFNYDKNLEREIAGDDSWVDLIQSIRKAVEDLEIRHVVSPRASIKGAKLKSLGFDKQTILDRVVWKGLDESSIETIRQNVSGLS